MSLKAKIEAVIYASEEPVTLAQLIGLLGHEAQAELDHLDAAQQSLALTDSGASSRHRGRCRRRSRARRRAPTAPCTSPLLKRPLTSKPCASTPTPTQQPCAPANTR